MKTRQIFLLTLLVLFTAYVLAGCGGGSKSQNIDTGYRGSLAGVDTIPPDDDYDVPVDAWVKVFWPLNYEPPRTFTFKLYRWDGEWKVVKTKYKSNDSDPYYQEWWFEPVDGLSFDRDYRIVVSDEYGNSHIHYFTTEYDYTRAAPPAAGQTEKGSNLKRENYKPKNGGTPGGTAADQHTIDTTKKK